MYLPAWIPVLGPWLARGRMKRDLPPLMTEWGFAFEESDRRGWWGRFTGTLGGYPASVEPESRQLTVGFRREIEDIRLSTLDPGLKPRDHGLGHPRFEAVFPWIEIEPRVAARLRDRADVLDRLLALWSRRVAGITVGPGGLTCILHDIAYPARGPHWVETADVRRLLPEMMEVVRLLEEVLSVRAR